MRVWVHHVAKDQKKYIARARIKFVRLFWGFSVFNQLWKFLRTEINLNEKDKTRVIGDINAFFLRNNVKMWYYAIVVLDIFSILTNTQAFQIAVVDKFVKTPHFYCIEKTISLHKHMYPGKRIYILVPSIKLYILLLQCNTEKNLHVYWWLRWFLNFTELDRVFKAMVQTEMRVPLIPCVLCLMRVPMFTAAALTVLVHPSTAIVTFTPRPVPSFSILPFPPRFSLFYTVTIWVEMFVPLISPFGPSITLGSLSPFVGVLGATALPVVLLPPPAT